MASDTYGHRYEESQAVWTCTRCGVAQAAAAEYGIPCDGGPDERRARTLAGMLAAIEYARTMHGGMAGAAPQPAAAASLYAIEEDCKRGALDLAGSLASVTLRAAEKSRVFTGVSVPEFLDELEAEVRAGFPRESGDS